MQLSYLFLRSCTQLIRKDQLQPLQLYSSLQFLHHFLVIYTHLILSWLEKEWKMASRLLPHHLYQSFHISKTVVLETHQHVILRRTSTSEIAHEHFYLLWFQYLLHLLRLCSREHLFPQECLLIVQWNHRSRRLNVWKEVSQLLRSR